MVRCLLLLVFIIAFDAYGARLRGKGNAIHGPYTVQQRIPLENSSLAAVVKPNGDAADADTPLSGADDADGASDEDDDGASDDDDDGASDDDDDDSPSSNSNDDESRKFEQGYVFVVVIALVLFCGCGCLSTNSTALESVSAVWRRPSPHGFVREEDSMAVRDHERRLVLLRDSMVESGESVWICFVCAFENKPRARSCALCGASNQLARTFDDRLRGSHWKKSPPSTPQRPSEDEADNAASSHTQRVNVDRVVTPSRRGDAASLDAVMMNEASRAQAFVVGRLNGLTLRQKGAARRHIWSRKRHADGKLRWVRVSADEDSSSRDSFAYIARLEEEQEEEYSIRWSCVNRANSDHDEAEEAAQRPAPAAEEKSAPEQRRPGWRCRCCGGSRSDRRSSPSLWSPLLLDCTSDGDALRQAEDMYDDDLEAIAAYEFREKQAWFERKVKKETLSRRPLAIQVRRECLLVDSMRRFEQASGARLKRCPLRIKFRGEVAIDAGGVEREWFEIVAKHLFSNELGYFETRREAGYAANIQPRSDSALCSAEQRQARRLAGLHDSDHLRVFRFAGRFVAKALREQVALPVCLALPLLKHLLSVPLSFSDLEFVDAESFQSYAWLRDNDPEPLGLDFTLDGGHELVPDGENVKVTQTNKAHYLALVLRYRVLDAVKAQLISFLRGFDEVIHRAKPPLYLSVFDYQELQLLIGGLSDFDLDDWKRHTRYLGAFAQHKEKHPVISMFWKALATFDNTQRARLVQFVTGSSQLPPSGFKALVGDDGRYCNFTLASMPRSLGVWPRAHT